MNFADLILGFEVAFEPINLLYAFVGVVIGMVVGVLPGLGPAATIALMLPLTYSVPPQAAIIMVAGIYYGAYYGGTITAVLLRLPGEAASVVTAYDGYQMALQGRAGPALGISAIGSFVGGVVATIGLLFFAPVVAEWAVTLGPPEFAVLAFAGILMIATLGQGGALKNLISACLGLMVAMVGTDLITGSSRFTFGSVDMLSGIDFVAVAMGLFGVGDILYELERGGAGQKIKGAIGRVLPTRKDMRDASGAIARGTLAGFFLGLLPGGGGVVSSLASYSMEKKLSKHPEEFGHGAIAGVAGPETANNAGSTASFLPLLTLGIPSNVVLALVYGALLIQGVTPGPQLVSEHPDIFWGVIASMVVGNLMLLLLSIPLIKPFIALTKVHMSILSTVVVMITMIGVFSISNSTFDMWTMIAFGIIGYWMRKTGYDPGPFALAIVLGPLLESSFRQTMLMSEGSFAIFAERPVTLIGLLAIVLLASGRVLMNIRRKRVLRRGGETLLPVETPSALSTSTVRTTPRLRAKHTARTGSREGNEEETR